MKTFVTWEEILLQEENLRNAIMHGDVQALDILLHDDLLFVLPGGQVVTKKIDLDTYRDGRLKISAFVPAVETLNIIEDTAVIQLIVGLEGEYDGAAFKQQFRYVRFWKKLEDGIRVIGGSGTAL
ncbi:nuclear transport factor 2 family protein [Pedobacter sp. UBA4863]|uniref:nuclear transport factor 2 family protein n=1 Tax=Pedobacter sp. UBA4863 TaxID=1947060 RepID=UPI0025E2A202|nr:nuclear transport factor 2 family protein [Pedobacter sp. UBA4863]